jgi:branched-chain amino acid aminotransferase
MGSRSGREKAMEIIRAGEIMATHPEHRRLPYPEGYGFGAAFIIDHYCPLIEAAVPITDCGFMHADAVYDVVSVSRGAFFRLDQHQDRFARARQAIRVRSPYTREEEAEILHKMVALAGLRDAYVWWSVTRGAPPLGRSEMVDPDRFECRFYAFACPFIFIADDEQRTRGLDLVVSRERVRISPRAVDPRAKNLHWLDMQMALFEAGDRGAEWAVLPDEQGYLTEAAGANIFVVKDGAVLTPDAAPEASFDRASSICVGLAFPRRPRASTGRASYAESSSPHRRERRARAQHRRPAGRVGRPGEIRCGSTTCTGSGGGPDGRRPPSATSSRAERGSRRWFASADQIQRLTDALKRA